MRKGITPIISIIVLLLITVALAGVAWVYLSGFLGTQMNTVTIPPNGVYCAGQSVQVLVANTGQSALEVGDIAVLSMVGGDTACDNAGAPVIGTQADTIDSGSSGIISFGCLEGGSPCTCAGTYSVTIGTSGAVQTQSVSC